MSGDVPEEFRPRQCHVVKWPEFQGYGFNLHAEKGKAGQYIGKVDGNSPAEAAGLKEGDRIVEVNNVNIGNENHQQVVARVRSGGEETRLLVVDTNADNWYKEQKKVIKGDLPEVLFISAARNVEEPQVETVPEPVEVAQEPEPVPEPVVEPEPVPEPEPEPVVAAVVSSEPSNGVNGDTTHRPRLCHLRIWPHFQGYGFNLHAERDKPGQYIGLVDDDSPASTAGLKVNDRIVEVNGVNIEQQTHTEVISRIKEVPGQTRLLVVDREADQYFREKGVAVSSYLPETEFLSSADPNAVNGEQPSEPEPAPEPEYTLASSEPTPQPQPSPTPVREEPAPPAPEPTPAPVSAPQPTTPAPAGTDALGMGLSVAEMKERLKAKKKQDPRLSKMSFEQKYKDFQRL